MKPEQIVGCIAVALLMTACAKSPQEAGDGLDNTSPFETISTAAVANATASVPELRGNLADTPFGIAVATAVAKDPRIRSARSEIGLAEADALAAEGAFRPGFDAGVDLRQSGSSAENWSGDVTPFVRVRQLLYDGGVSRAQRTAAASEMERSKDATLLAISEAALEAVTAWADLHAAREIKRLFERNLQTHSEVLAQIEERQRIGAGSQGDVLKIRARTADAQIEAINAESDLDKAEARFLEVFGHRPDSLGPVPPAPRLSALPTALEAAFAYSPRLRAAEAQLAIAEARLAEARANRLPRVEFSSRVQPDRNDIAEMVFDLSLAYSFDTRRAFAAAIARAEAAVTTAEAELEQAKRDVRQSMDFLQSDKATSTRRQQAARDAVEANLRTVLAARDEFSIGRRELPEVLDAQRDFVRAERAMLEAERESVLIGYEALALIGNIATAFEIEVTR